LKIAVVGGKLQGTEATYLAHKAGWEVILIDKKPVVPAKGLADEFYQMDVMGETPDIRPILKKAALIVPAFEDTTALNRLKEAADQEGVPIAYDEPSYKISSSKKSSDRLFADLDLPAPRAWPTWTLPVLAKPSGLSGSRGVQKIMSQKELDAFLASTGRTLENWVIQEYLEGPSYSLEVFGLGERFVSLQTTTIEVDALYDCKRVLAPANISAEQKNEFGRMSRRIASALKLKGIMDVEVILHQGQLKVLEIDARLPSQTPTAVLKSTGINMIELLGNVFVKDSLPESVILDQEKAVIYEHIKVTPEAIEVSGEHIMAGAAPLKIQEGFFGADEAITDYDQGKSSWVATLIFVEKSQREVWARRCATIESLKKHLGISVFSDPIPGENS
jgi:pyrrolysine biosynthesis protein PylC